MYPVKIIDKYRWNICWFSYLSKHRIGENLAENKPPTMANEKMTIKSHLFVEASVPSLCSSLLFFRWITEAVSGSERNSWRLFPGALFTLPWVHCHFSRTFAENWRMQYRKQYPCSGYCKFLCENDESLKWIVVINGKISSLNA